MKTADIAAALVAGFQQQATGTTDMGYHVGVVESWDDVTALNSVVINGNTFNNLRVITAGPAINIEAGDTVVILRLQTQYYILGKVAAAGASAAMRSVSDFVTNSESTSSSSFTDLATPGPSKTIYVGPSGQVLVIMSAQAIVPTATRAAMSVALTGANTQAAVGFRAATRSVDSAVAGDTASNSISYAVQIVDLVQGQTTFTAKYQSTGGSSIFGNRSLIVMPI